MSPWPARDDERVARHGSAAAREHEAPPRREAAVVARRRPRRAHGGAAHVWAPLGCWRRWRWRCGFGVAAHRVPLLRCFAGRLLFVYCTRSYLCCVVARVLRARSPDLACLKAEMSLRLVIAWARAHAFKGFEALIQARLAACGPWEPDSTADRRASVM